MRFVRVCLPLLVLACGGDQRLVGHIQVVAQAVAPAQLTRVTVTVTPAGVTQDLIVDPLDASKFTGIIEVPVGTQTVRADAFAGGTTPVGTGSATVPVVKGAHVQALITILDTTGPSPGPDHSPVVTSLVAPLAAQVDDQPTLSATAMDGDGDAMSFSWTASPAGCGTFATPTAATTLFTPRLVGACTVTFTVTANGKSDSKSAQVQIAAATGFIDVSVQYVPQPVISSIAFSTGSTQIASVARTATDATIRAPFHKGTPYTVTLSFDRWPTGSVGLADSCGGTIVPPSFVANAPSATATWTPTVASGACIITATLIRETLTDSLFVVVLPVP